MTDQRSGENHRHVYVSKLRMNLVNSTWVSLSLTHTHTHVHCAFCDGRNEYKRDYSL